MRLIPRCLLAAACCVTFALAGCDRDVTDPGADRDDVEALLARAGLAPAGSELTLPALLRDAIRTVQREQGTEAARLQLDRLRSLRTASTSDAPVDSLQAQLRLVLDILGGGTLNRTLRATTDRLHILDAAVDSARGDTAPLRVLQSSARGELEAAGVALAGGDSIAALGHSAAAAGHAAALRRALLDRRRVQSLPELFARARARLDTVAGNGAAEMLARHESLAAAAREAVSRGGRSEAYRALTALRDEEVRLTIGVLGEGVAAKVVRDVAVALDELRPQLGGNVKLQRMHRAAHDLQVRAAAELDRGRPDSALDLGSHAASLANALRLVATLR